MRCCPSSCGPSSCGPSSCGPSSCGPSSCGPSSCGPSSCGPSSCGPSSCGPSHRKHYVISCSGFRPLLGPAAVSSAAFCRILFQFCPPIHLPASIWTLA
ncbi:hypothetical protein CgunFtcFv8_008958 [Champsocephalus gunnari]|uniref:Uncharacterized protein n=1 Tax=Champsocephalus gunnari TaxID=52237 RepID=A0AAN8D3D9_CHAGU|nr:hypothetical protein CgunFtcFv8_008958 [Champsocephalus gunnari]